MARVWLVEFLHPSKILIKRELTVIPSLHWSSFTYSINILNICSSTIGPVTLKGEVVFPRKERKSYISYEKATRLA